MNAIPPELTPDAVIRRLTTELESQKALVRHLEAICKAAAARAVEADDSHENELQRLADLLGYTEADAAVVRAKLEAAEARIAEMLAMQEARVEESEGLRKRLADMGRSLEACAMLSKADWVADGWVCALCKEPLAALDAEVYALTERYNKVVARCQNVIAAHAAQAQQLKLAGKLGGLTGIQHQLQLLGRVHADIAALREDFVSGVFARSG